MTALLGGTADPLGRTLQFVAAPLDVVLADLVAWRTGLGQHPRVTERLPGGLAAVLPEQTPWRRELLVPYPGTGWTAYANSGRSGGDPTASAVVVARRLGVRHVTAQHTPLHGPGHAATQLWLSGPDGVPPLMAVRTLSATATDGRWAWHASGVPQDFEDPDRYAARRVRDRLDRPLLLQYLAALGITVPAVDAAGGVLVERPG